MCHQQNCYLIGQLEASFKCWRNVWWDGIAKRRKGMKSDSSITNNMLTNDVMPRRSLTTARFWFRWKHSEMVFFVLGKSLPTDNRIWCNITATLGYFRRASRIHPGAYAVLAIRKRPNLCGDQFDQSDVCWRHNGSRANSAGQSTYLNSVCVPTECLATLRDRLKTSRACSTANFVP